MTFGIKKIKEDLLKNEPAILLYKMDHAAPFPYARASPTCPPPPPPPPLLLLLLLLLLLPTNTTI